MTQLSPTAKSDLCHICGDCCNHIVFDFNVPNPWPDREKWEEWIVARGGVICPVTDENFVSVRFNWPCPHLVVTIDDEHLRYSCGVQDQKPQICVEYDGSQNTRKDGLVCLWKVME